MANITVQIIEIASNKFQTVELPDNVPVNQIIHVLLDKMGLPKRDSYGQPITYKFYHQPSGIQLQDSQCLAYIGCKESDVIKLQPIHELVFPHGNPPNTNTNSVREIECSNCHTRLAAGISYCWSCGKPVNHPTNLQDETLAGPWSRWAARQIDITLWHIVAMFLCALFIPVQLPPFLFVLMAFPLAFVFDALTCSIFGNSLGKWCFDIKVTNNNDSKVTLENYLMRNLRCYWGGYGLGLPFVQLCTFVYQYNRVSKGMATTYDEKLKHRVVSSAGGSIPKKALGVLILIVALLLYGLLMQE